MILANVIFKKKSQSRYPRDCCIVFYLSYSAFLYKWLNLKHVILVILVVLTEEFDRSNSVGTSKSVPCAALAAAAAACCCLCCLAFFITLKL